jgi:hypothetical protein
MLGHGGVERNAAAGVWDASQAGRDDADRCSNP